MQDAAGTPGGHDTGACKADIEPATQAFVFGDIEGRLTMTGKE